MTPSSLAKTGSIQCEEAFKITVAKLIRIACIRSSSLFPHHYFLFLVIIIGTSWALTLSVGLLKNKRVEVKKAVSKRSGKIGDYYNTYNAIFNGSYGVYYYGMYGYGYEYEAYSSFGGLG
ncbi:hypothetical protein Tco_1153249 [Tanacetum coccineum]